jgi:hypothetical protein
VLIAIEDRGSRVLLTSVDGSLHAGVITAVGSDHLEVSNAAGRRILALVHVVAVEER